MHAFESTGARVELQRQRRTPVDASSLADDAPARERRGAGDGVGLCEQAALSLGWPTRLGAGFGNDELITSFVDVHSHPIPPETPDPKEVRAFERDVGVPVHVPQLQTERPLRRWPAPSDAGRRARSDAPVRGRQATAASQRVSVFIYDPRQSRSAAPNTRAARGRHRPGPRRPGRGYSVAVTQHGCVGYAIASDLEDSSAQLVADCRSRVTFVSGTDVSRPRLARAR